MKCYCCGCHIDEDMGPLADGNYYCSVACLRDSCKIRITVEKRWSD